MAVGNYLYLAVSLVLWASAFVAIRIGLTGFGYGDLALLRFLTASAALALFAFRRRPFFPKLRDVPTIFLLGFLGFALYNVTLNAGEFTVSAGTASLLINTSPIFTAVFAAWLLKEKLNFRGWMGLLISLGGTALIVLGRHEGLAGSWGAMLVLVASLASAAYVVVEKPLMDRYTPLELTTWAIWAAAVELLPFTPSLLHQIQIAPLSAVCAAVYLGVFPAALAFYTWNYVLSKMSASSLAAYQYLMPVFAIAMAWFWLGEIPTVLTLIGGGVAAGGVLLVTWRTLPKKNLLKPSMGQTP